MKHIPKTPFSTRLSGGAKETQLRLRSIFQWKKRPLPVWLFTLTVFVLLGCFGLVSCQQPEEPQEGPDIPATTMPTETPSEMPTEEPAQPADPADFFARYVTEFPDYTYDGELRPVPDGRTFALYDTPENPAEQLVVQNYNSIVAGENGAYRAITIHALDTLTPEDFVPGGEYFPEENGLDWFLAEMQSVIMEHALAEYTVVSADLSWTHTPEQLALGPQLGDGRFVRYWLVGKAAKSGEEAEWKLYECFWAEHLGRWYSDESYLSTLLAETALEDYALLDVGEVVPLYYRRGEYSPVLAMLYSYPHAAGMNNLVLGVWKEWDGTADSRRFVGETYALRGDAADYACWTGADGKLYFLLTNTAFWQGMGSGSGLRFFSFDGKNLERLYDLPDCARESGLLPEDALTDDSDFWPDHMARVAQRGIELYGRNPAWDLYGAGQEEQWLSLGFVPFEDSGVNEVSLKHGDDYSPNVLTLGPWNEAVFSYLDYDAVERRRDDLEPVHHPGDYWNEYIRPEVNAIRYYSHAENIHYANTITVSDPAFATPRGISTRSTRAEVLAAYPEIKSGDYWGKYPGEDYLWYCEDPNDLGPAILFFFVNDRVSSIVLNNMFN